MITPFSSEQVLPYVQRERVRTSVRWHRPEPSSPIRRGLDD
jgi:hypothetical protein